MNTRCRVRRDSVKDHPKKGSNNGVKHKQKNRQKLSIDEPKDSIEKWIYNIFIILCGIVWNIHMHMFKF